jgi:hypothetical protein
MQESVTQFVRQYLEQRTSIVDVSTNAHGSVIIWSDILPPSDFYTTMKSDLANYYNLTKMHWYGCARSYNQAKTAHGAV